MANSSFFIPHSSFPPPSAWPIPHSSFFILHLTTPSAWLFIEHEVRFSPQRSVGLFIEFCLHEVPVWMADWLEANSFADKQDAIHTIGQSPRQNVFLSHSQLMSEDAPRRISTRSAYLPVAKNLCEVMCFLPFQNFPLTISIMEP